MKRLLLLLALVPAVALSQGMVSSGSSFGVGDQTANGNVTIQQPAGSLRSLTIKAPGPQGGITDGTWLYGQPYVAGVGLQAIQWLYQDAVTPQHIVESMESQGTQAMIGNNDRRSRYEGYDLNGQVNPTFRITTYPSMGYEFGQLTQVAAIGAMTRVGSTVTVSIPNHNFETGQVLSLQTNDTNYPSAVNAYTITVTDAGHFTYTSAGTTVASTAIGIWSTETTMKFRLAGNNHLQLVIGPYSGEAVGMEWYADSMVTGAGYGASYGGSILYQPTVVSSTPYSLGAGSTYLCDATAGAVTFNLAATSGYFGKPGRHITVKKTDASANACTIARASADTIDGATTFALAAQYKYVTLESDGAGHWYNIGSN